MNNKGWVRTWREQFSHEISDRKPWCDGYAWIFLYSAANYRDGIANFRNQYIPVKRGQLLTSKIKLQAIFGWSKKRLNSFLTSLEVRGMSTIRVTNRFIVITIHNYDIYQPIVNENEPTDVQIDAPTESQQRATIKEINKNNISPEKIFSQISLLKEKYSDQNLINQVFNAISQTRKTNRISDSVKLNILQQWDKYPVNQVMAGIKIYLEKDYAGTGKDEKYLLGIIRGSSKQTPADVKEDAKESTSISTCPRCQAQIPPQDRFGEGCIHCETWEVTSA